MIKVLLVSPLDPKQPGNLKFLMGGENTYTRTLLKNPPRGVKYIHYTNALQEGLIEYLPTQKFLYWLVKLRILPLSAGTQAIKIIGEIDLVHCHGYSIKVTSQELPVIVSDSSSNYLFLHDYVKWPEWRIRLGYWFRGQLFRWLGVIDCDTNWQNAKKIIVFSKFAEKIHRSLGVPAGKMEVVYPGIATVIPAPSKGGSVYGGKVGIHRRSNVWIPHQVRDDKSVNILFVGIWFERKGGPLLLEAFKKLSDKYSNISLTIVGKVPKKYKSSFSSSEGVEATESRSKIGSSRRRSNNIEQFDFISREKLIKEFYPKADILVLVPPVAEGFGFVVLEAMSFGIPAVVSDVSALSEIVDDGQTGFVIKRADLAQLVEKLEILIKNSDLRIKLGRQARDRFRMNFLSKIVGDKLLGIYQEALKVKRA